MASTKDAQELIKPTLDEIQQMECPNCGNKIGNQQFNTNIVEVLETDRSSFRVDRLTQRRIYESKKAKKYKFTHKSCAKSKYTQEMKTSFSRVY